MGGRTDRNIHERTSRKKKDKHGRYPTLTLHERKKRSEDNVKGHPVRRRGYGAGVKGGLGSDDESIKEVFWMVVDQNKNDVL